MERLREIDDLLYKEGNENCYEIHETHVDCIIHCFSWVAASGAAAFQPLRQPLIALHRHFAKTQGHLLLGRFGYY